MTNRKQDFFSDEFPLLLSIIVIILFIVGEMVDFLVRREASATWTVFLAFATFLLTERLKTLSDFYSSERDKRQKTEEMQEIKSIIAQNSDLRTLGLPSDGLDWLTRGLNGEAVFVQDTLFRVTKNVSFNDDNYKLFTQALDKYLAAGRRYVTIGNDVGISSVDKHIDRLNDHRYYSLYKAIIAAPVVNYTIIEYKNGNKEVAFGWDFDHSILSHVFLSSSMQVVSYFERLFSATISVSEEIIAARTNKSAD